MEIRESVIRTILISLVYALIEAYFNPALMKVQGNVISPYHLLVLSIGLIAGFDRNIYILIANTLTYSVLEDMFYWIFKFQLPYEWASEYIVVNHIPVYYIPYTIVSILLYKKGMKDENKYNI